jgi:ABC-type nitrate/sulfonate/bicarbonate transport system permease component
VSGTLQASGPPVQTPRPTRSVLGGALTAVGRALFTMAMVIVTIIVLWVAGLQIFDVSDYVGKGPDDVWAHLVTEEDAAENRAVAFDLLGETLRDAAIGFVAGMAAAIVLAVAIVSSRVLETAVMPVALILRSVPLIALAPIIILLVGRGHAVVAAMGGIVVLFPALVTIVFGLRSVSSQVRDVVTVYGGSSWTVLRKVAFPTALPAVFGAVRISVPGAFTGALLAEWLATGEGIGHAVVSAANRSQNTQVWSLVVVVTVAALALYLLAQLVESLVLHRFAMKGSGQ